MRDTVQNISLADREKAESLSGWTARNRLPCSLHKLLTSKLGIEKCNGYTVQSIQFSRDVSRYETSAVIAQYPEASLTYLCTAVVVLFSFVVLTPAGSSML